jgi:hypothetical protein
VNHIKHEFSKLGFEIGDFRRRSGFVEIEGLKKEIVLPSTTQVRKKSGSC